MITVHLALHGCKGCLVGPPPLLLLCISLLDDLTQGVQQLLPHIHHAAHKLRCAQRGCHTEGTHQLPARVQHNDLSHPSPKMINQTARKTRPKPRLLTCKSWIVINIKWRNLMIHISRITDKSCTHPEADKRSGHSQAQCNCQILELLQRKILSISSGWRHQKLSLVQLLNQSTPVKDQVNSSKVGQNDQGG